jgi:hypothetical protein
MLRKAGPWTALAGALLALAAWLAFRAWGPGAGDADDEAQDSFPPDALADYLPADSAAVVTVNVRTLLDAPVVRDHLEPALRRLVRRGTATEPWFGLAGVDPLADLDRLGVVFAARDPGRPLWLARGRFDPGRFQVGPGRLQAPARGQRVYRYADPDAGTTLLAPVGDTLAVSTEPRRLADALDYAAHPHPVALRDPSLRALLDKVDRGQAVWLAASLDRLGPTDRLENRALELMLRPVLSHARGVEGGVSAGEDLRAAFTFHAADDGDARRLEEVLRNVIVVVQGAPLFLGSDRDLALLLRLVGSGETTREGTVVVLRCRLPADQLGP